MLRILRPRRTLSLVCFAVAVCLSAAAVAAPIGQDSPPPEDEPSVVESVPFSIEKILGGSNSTPEARAWADRFKHPQIAAAQVALVEGNLEKCLGLLQAASQADPQLPPEVLLLAYLYFKQQRWHEGRISLEKAAALYSSHPEVYQACGQFALLQDRQADAWAHFRTALELKPPVGWSEENLRQFKAGCYAGMADVAERRQDWANAVALFENWRAVGELDSGGQFRWARALLSSGDEAAAFEKLKDAHQSDANFNPPDLAMGALQTELGHFAAARKQFEKAIDDRPKDGKSYFEFAGALLIAGELAEAEKMANRAGELLAKDDELSGELLLVQGMIARGQKQHELAEKCFTELLRQSPKHDVARNQLPLALIEQEDTAKQRQALQLAMIQARAQPQSSAALASLGWVQYRLGRIADAETSLRTAASGGTTDGDTLYFLAQVLAESGKPAETRSAVARLQVAVAQPRLFILRADAQQWLESAGVLLGATP